jgi:hypothetical protein
MKKMSEEKKLKPGPKRKLSDSILFVISLISFQKICNRPSQIHCLNSDGTGDLSLLRYKPDFVTSLFVINELYCTTNHKEYVKEKKLIATHAP